MSDKHQKSDTKVQKERYKNFDLEERMARFGEDIIAFCKSLKLDTVSRPLVSQVVRSATSIGANYCEANNAISRKDFKHKATLAKKEAQETKHWLRMLKVAISTKKQQLSSLWQEAHELNLILQSIINKVGTT